MVQPKKKTKIASVSLTLLLPDYAHPCAHTHILMGQASKASWEMEH